MEVAEKHRRAIDSHRAAKLQFILTELELALTFCRVALSARDSGRAERNERNARRAYSAAKHFLRGEDFSEKVKRQVREKAGELEPLLRQLRLRRFQPGPRAARRS
jgi:hypothetical protein